MKIRSLKYLILHAAMLILLVATSCQDKNLTLNKRYARAYKTLSAGDIVEANRQFVQLIEEFSEQQNWERVSICHYNMATTYLNQRDMIGLQQVLQKMHELHLQHPENQFITYDYESVLHGYKVAMFEETGDTAIRNEAMEAGRRSIECLEKLTYDEQRTHLIYAVWNYYNMAVSFDLYYSPVKIDSVQKYLDKARAANLIALEKDKIHGDISIRDLQAWLYFYDAQKSTTPEAQQHFYQLAENEMNTVLLLIDSIEPTHQNSVLSEREQAYAFMTELYESKGETEKALHYQKLCNELTKERYSVEKNRALHEVEAQYNVEKKDRVIRELALATIGLILLVLAGTTAGVLRHRYREESEYTKAVDADHDTQTRYATLLAIVQALQKDFPSVKTQLANVDLELVERIMCAAKKPLSLTEKRYLICFVERISVNDIARFFHISPTSVYTVRYRLKKKFPVDFDLPF